MIEEKLDHVNMDSNNIKLLLPLIPKILDHVQRQESQINTLQKACEGQLHTINELEKTLKKYPIDELNSQLIALKESIDKLDIPKITIVNDKIKQLNEEIASIKKFHKNIGKVIISHDIYFKSYFLRILIFLSKLLNRIAKRYKQFMSSKIGDLNQYPPKPFIIPSHYKKIKLSNELLKFSIVTPSFNQGDFIEKTIQSVLEQNYPSLEYIIQDGGSVDPTVDIIQRYQTSLKHWESKKDGGQSNAINLGFKHASGEIMAYLNSDDILLPGSLHYVNHFFSKHPEIDVVYGHRFLINEKDQDIGLWILPKHDSEVLTWCDYIPQETLFWRRHIWDKVGGQIDETYRFAMDWDLLLRFKEAGAKFKRLPRFLGAFRVHQNQKTSAQISAIGMKEMDRIRFRCHNRIVTNQEIKKNIKSYLIRHLICHKLYRARIFQY